MRSATAEWRSLRPVLLSALVFPGAGQLASGRPWQALAFGAATLLPLIVLIRRVWTETLARLPADPVVMLDTLDAGLPFRLAREIQQANARLFLGLTLVLIAVWLASIAEAWRAGRSHARRPDARRPD